MLSSFVMRAYTRVGGGPTRGHLSLLLLALMLLSGTAGCFRGQKRYVEPERLDKGLIVILPGIEGESKLNHDIADGLKDAGVASAIDIHDWTGTRLLTFFNTVRYERNMRQASLIAHRIGEYQRQHPGRPVHLVGHSGGGGMAVMVLEQLNSKKPITAAILLAPALSPYHNLAEALRRTERGIYNFWSPGDFGWLGLGTSTFGSMDREFGPAAGMVGFKIPENLTRGEADLYETRLHQIRWRPEMLKDFHILQHTGWASRKFVRDWIGKIILSHESGHEPQLN